jgi:hypothetical protein
MTTITQQLLDEGLIALDSESGDLGTDLKQAVSTPPESLIDRQKEIDAITKTISSFCARQGDDE